MKNLVSQLVIINNATREFVPFFERKVIKSDYKFGDIGLINPEIIKYYSERLKDKTPKIYNTAIGVSGKNLFKDFPQEKNDVQILMSDGTVGHFQNNLGKAHYWLEIFKKMEYKTIGDVQGLNIYDVISEVQNIRERELNEEDKQAIRSQYLALSSFDEFILEKYSIKDIPVEFAEREIDKRRLREILEQRKSTPPKPGVILPCKHI